MIGVGVSKGIGLYVEDHSLPLSLTFCVTSDKSPTKLLLHSSCFAYEVYLFFLFFLCLISLQC